MRSMLSVNLLLFIHHTCDDIFVDCSTFLGVPTFKKNCFANQKYGTVNFNNLIHLYNIHTYYC